MGDVILRQQDIVGEGVPDASVTTRGPSTCTIPSERPVPGHRAARGPSVPIKPSIPYRCFYSRNIENPFAAGGTSA